MSPSYFRPTIFIIVSITYNTYASILEEVRTPPNTYKKISTFVQKNVPFFHKTERQVVVVLVAQEITEELNDILVNWLRAIHQDRVTQGIKVFTEEPEGSNKMESFTDTFIFLKTINEKVLDNLSSTLFNKSGVWFRDERFIFVLTKDFNGSLDMEKLSNIIKLPWDHTRMLNYIIICMFPEMQVLGYSPFKQKIQNFSSLENYSFSTLFSDKLKNLYGYNVTFTYCILCSKYVITQNGEVKGQGYDFAKTFIKHMKGTVNELNRVDFPQIGADLNSSRADMSAIGMFLYQESIRAVGYPHGFMDMVVFVPIAEISATFAFIYIFDPYTWLSTLVILVLYRVVWLLRVKLFSSFQPSSYLPEDGMKMLVFVFSLFNILITQIIQCWITTFLIHPHQLHNINTINELIESKQPIYGYFQWEAFLTPRLKNQYVFSTGVSYIKNDKKAKLPAFLLSADVASDLANSPFWKDRAATLHQVKEPVGTAYMTFYLSGISPYRKALRDFTFKSLAYGFFSKDWGIYKHMNNAGQEHKVQKLRIAHLTGMFLLWGVGMVLSALVLLLERAWNRHLMLRNKVYEFAN